MGSAPAPPVAGLRHQPSYRIRPRDAQLHRDTGSPRLARPTLDPAAVLAARPRQCHASRRVALAVERRRPSAEPRARSWAAAPSPRQWPGRSRLCHCARSMPTACTPLGSARHVTPVISPSAMLRDVVLWQVLPDGTVREVTQPQLVDRAPVRAGRGVLRPARGRRAVLAEGRYVFEIRRLEGPGSRWIGLEFIPTQG